ncbi:MAG: pyruvate dehydrogenase (acetyl-transferring) E1 component subunit alpha [Myxococcota bacterium]
MLTMYRKMLLARRFEEKAGQAYGQKKIQGFCHLYIGQEAVVVGINEAIRPTDWVMTGYRDHVHPLVRGSDAGMLMAELFGRDGGYSKGKGGSMHFFDVEHRFYGGYGIVGGQIPLAAGMAFAAKYRGEDHVTVCSFGDAASNQGALHETFNMAVKWKLPVLYVVENNKYGMGTDIARVSAVPEIHQRGPGWDMRAESVDGMDVLAVYEKTKELVEWIRAGNGPVLLEAFTYRFRGHSMSDAATYRTKEEVEYEKQRDPIIKLRQLMMDKGLVNEAQLETIDEEEKIVVEKALAFADASPLPPDSDVWSHTTVEEGEPDVKPRERVLGLTNVDWPNHPTDFTVTWELEPRSPPPNEEVGTRANASRKGAA